ncbi:MAG: DHH family phosphoesterase [Candidatus Saccharimonadaceae bacterium]
MFDDAIKLISDAQNIVVVQAENADADSLGSSLALEEILSDQGKKVTMFCAIDIPKYLRYLKGWDRVVKDWPNDSDLVILVDTSSEALLQKTLKIPNLRHFLETHSFLVIDHHGEASDNITAPHTLMIDPNSASTGEMILKMSIQASWTINQQAAEHMLISILGDTLGLTTQSVTADTFASATKLVELGAKPADIEERRRDYMRKPAEILSYKGDLIKRIEYSLEGKLALVHIPWEDIQKYSDRYNPSVLVLDEMRLVEDVRVACAIKTYPDGKLTGKLRTNAPIAATIAGYFGGGGHNYSAGFKVYESYEKIMQELLTATEKAINEYDTKVL